MVGEGFVDFEIGLGMCVLVDCGFVEVGLWCCVVFEVSDLVILLDLVGYGLGVVLLLCDLVYVWCGKLVSVKLCGVELCWELVVMYKVVVCNGVLVLDVVLVVFFELLME